MCSSQGLGEINDTVSSIIPVYSVNNLPGLDPPAHVTVDTRPPRGYHPPNVVKSHTRVMGTKERRERERLETRDKILEAAREMFATHGIEATTMRAIAN